MSRHQEPLQTSSISVYPLSSSQSRQAMAVCARLFSSCAGPNGRNHIVRNACGGHVTVSSACSRLLSSISFSRSELKLLVSAVTGHLHQCGDCGLFMIHVCLQLTTAMLDLDMDVHHSLVSSTFLSFVSIITDYLQSDSCVIRIKSDFSNVKLLLSYIRSIINSKSLLNIQTHELNNLSLTVLNAFVRAIPSVPTQRYSSGVFVLGLERRPISESKCVDGMLIEFPDLSCHGNSDEVTNKISSRLCEDDEGDAFVKVALVTCSMSGDMDGIVNATMEGTNEQFSDLEDHVYGKMTCLCNALDRQKVGLVLCQKVIHPKLKAYLRTKGIIHVDRLGSQPVAFIRDLTGCQPITSLLQTSQDDDRTLGRLTSVSHCVENNKSYLCLKNTRASVVTLVVCSEWEERLSELKHCVGTCLKGLESLARDPWLLMGGGCWQMYCCHVLEEKVLSSLPEMCKKLSCPASTLRRLLSVFKSCLHKWCLGLKHDMEHISRDTSSFHCWRVSKNNIPVSTSGQGMKLCSCGFKSMSVGDLEDLDIVLAEDDTRTLSKKGEGGSDLPLPRVQEVGEYDDVVLDNMSACVEALHKGILTCGLLLSVGQFICDRN